jgi:haloacetate dehalogenase
MPELADLYSDFGSHTASTNAGRIFARVGGSGPPLVLLHGFPETGAMWHRIAPALSRRFTLIIPDLRGYGWSSAPASREGEGYSKRVMAFDIVALMEDLGHARFRFAGHDRGARVGYRLALDQPGRIDRLALLDVVPTVDVWRAREADPNVSPHWPWLARAEPEPEQAIKAGPDAYFEGLMAKWTGTKDLAAFAPEALAHYRAAWGDPSRIHAMCEDYRAGATIDLEADRADEAAGRTIACPTLILASRHFLVRANSPAPVDQWRKALAPRAEGIEIDSGHFMAEENADATLSALMDFL